MQAGDKADSPTKGKKGVHSGATSGKVEKFKVEKLKKMHLS